MKTPKSHDSTAAGTPDKCDPKLGRARGEARKQDALALLQARRAPCVRRGRRALLTCLLAGETATADDIREVVELPPGIDPKLFGSVPGPLVRAGIIRSDGFVKSSRPEAHARPVTVWRLSDRAKAEQWLTANPDYPDLVLGSELPLFPTETSPTVAAAGLDAESSQANERKQRNG